MEADIDFSEATAIVGLCPDMCPEPERAERERKGNLDKHERLDGNRKQTTKSLAVKMYNRTAGRDPDQIRPLPVLMRTMDYLLELMNRPYGDDFLGLYNFLWDRMRAVRMDLRMQHIFNLDAISMLEQMIRLHIIAMHEFCEYNKGEGFSEGFDAHLNIEQMNKASVELFQMYEDHKRKGIAVPTEPEFRGYYALLKLDKHPGYKVEPAELSLDLAKMSSQVRHSPEISFAREVAKACRMGNYVSFFRLAKKATFLQACLMHAHFSKLRNEALNSLHSSFTSDKGMPLSHLVKMLAMEGEDIESFVVRHGFVLKRFDEIYMVKAGPFLRGDPICKRSPLVVSKRSDKIKLDVCSPLEGKHLPAATPVKRADAIPHRPLTTPPDCTALVPEMEASDSFRTVLSKLSALSLDVASSNQKDAWIRKDEAEAVRLDNCEKMSKLSVLSKLKPTTTAMPDVHAKLLEEARANDKMTYHAAPPVKETIRPTIPTVPDMHAEILQEALADDEIPDNVAPVVKTRKFENMELKPTMHIVPDVYAKVFEEARADDDNLANAAPPLKRRKACDDTVQAEKHEQIEFLKDTMKPTIPAGADIHSKILEEARADDKIPYYMATAVRTSMKCEKLELKPTIQIVPDVHITVLEEAQADVEITGTAGQPLKSTEKCKKIDKSENLELTIPTVPDAVAEILEKDQKQSVNRFDCLLAQCIKMQDEIDEILYFYF